jgi:hypothetical protein
VQWADRPTGRPEQGIKLMGVFKRMRMTVISELMMPPRLS